MKKILSFLLCAVLLLSWSVAVYAVEGEDVIQIGSLEEFLTFAENCRLDSYSTGKSFLLTTDIDLTGVDFDGIPVFCGSFDGGYHSITGLKITSAGSSKGLFRYVQSGAVVKNLHVQADVLPTGTRTYVGGIAGTNSGILERCTFQGSVRAAEYAGGIAGINRQSGRIIGCTASGTVSAFHFSGGITGSNEGAVTGCTNDAGINLTAQQNQIGIGDITLDNFTNTESATATTDIGGIAGSSSGTILACTNRGQVGYPHMGYNVGGIVGLQSGYVADCQNYGKICGRKEVGGIAGQQEPQVIIRYDTDTLQLLKVQFAVLSNLIDKAVANGDANTATIRNLIHNIEKHITEVEDAIAYLQKALEEPKFEDLQSYADALTSIRDAIDGIETSLGKLWDAVGDTTADLEQDMAAITEQMAVIEEILNNADSHLGGQIFDISDQDTPEDLVSKIENCVNYGAIGADLNAGGIVGAIVFENDLDPEEDISVVGDTTLNAVGNIRSVILMCRNSGAVTAKNQRIGGIVGWLSLGLVKDCTHTGKLDNPTAHHVGGIAGESLGFIRTCKVKSVISGDVYVGGIAGSGTIVSDCFAMVELLGNEFQGGILGQAQEGYHEIEAPIAGNFYLQFGVDFGAIDGISYGGIAQGLDQDAFFAQAGSNLFDQVTIRFIADGEVVQEVVLEAGSALQELPKVPEKDGYSGQWQGIDALNFDRIFFDLQINAEYISYSSVIRADLSDEKGRPILLLQGDFGLSANATLMELPTFTGLREGEKLINAWEFSMAGCVNLYGGRLLLPKDADAAQVMLMVQDKDGKWAQRVFTVDGSYAVFSLSAGDTGLALVLTPKTSVFTPEILMAAGAGALVVLMVVLTVTLIRGKRKKTSKNETE
jgi:hypothetical protein